MTGLDRLRAAAFEMGEPGEIDEKFVDQFADQVNNDLNMPRALAVTWDLVRSDLPAAEKKATLLCFDRVLGLGLADWRPAETSVPEEIQALVQQRQQARAEKRWKDADTLRDQVIQAGFEIEDTPQGPRIKPKK